jgi:hypothetical protein
MLAGQSLQLGLRVVFKLADEDLSHGVDAITISVTRVLPGQLEGCGGRSASPADCRAARANR